LPFPKIFHLVAHHWAFPALCDIGLNVKLLTFTPQWWQWRWAGDGVTQCSTEAPKQTL